MEGGIINMYKKYLTEYCKEFHPVFFIHIDNIPNFKEDAVRLFSVVYSDRTAGKN